MEQGPRGASGLDCGKGKGETDGEAPGWIKAQLPELICTKLSQLQFPNLGGKG